METLNCSICFLRYDNNQREAVVLPCGHTFCSICTTSSNNKCPVCRENFTNAQVKKNYTVCSILDEMNAQAAQGLMKSQGQDRCATHKREIDRFCKSCLKLMCSVCHCSHIGSESDIMSDMNLREEVEEIFKTYKDVGKAKEEFSKKINDHINQKTREMQSSQEFSLDKIKREAQADIQKVQKEEEASIKRVEEEAQRKIRAIEVNKIKLMNQAKEVTRQRVKEIESRTAALVDTLRSEYQLLETIQNDCKNLRAKFETLQDLSKCKKETLEECLAVYKLEQAQRTPFTEFLNISRSDIDSLLALKRLEKAVEKRFEIGEIVDFFNKAWSEWASGAITKIRNNQVAVECLEGKEAWFDTNSPQLLKRWKKGNEFHIGNKIRLRVQGHDRLVEVRIVEIQSDKIKVFQTLFAFARMKGEKRVDEWIRKDSDRIFEFQK